MARGSADILRLLANPTNRAILSVLAAEPTYPRRLADVVGLTEDEASKRLRQFEKLGLAEADWANVGKTVRLYRLASAQITVTVTGSGLMVSALGEKEAMEVGGLGESVPVVPRFVGRTRERAEISALLSSRRAVCVHGIGGAGKTSLAANLATSWDGPVLWHTLAPQESGMLLLARLASAARALVAGEAAQRILSLRTGEEPSLLLAAIADAANASGALLILDRFEGAGEGAGDVAADLARGLTNGALLVTSRVFPRELPRDRIASYKLEGLEPDDASELLGLLSPVPPSAEAARALHQRTNGHALSLVLVSLAANTTPPDAARLSEENDVRAFLMGDVLPQLPEPEREVLLMLSLLRGPFLAEEAEAVCDRKHTRDALLRLEARGLVTRAGHTFSIHDLVRAFAAEAVPEARKTHARAARTLLATQEPAKVLEAMHHFLEAGDPNAAAAVVHQELIERTYRFQDQGLSPAYRDELARLETSRALKQKELAAVLIELALIDATRVAVDDAARRLDAAERALPRGKGDLATPLAIAQARLLHARGETRTAAALYAEAARAAEAKGDRALLLRSLIDQAFVEEEYADESALALYERAIDVGQEVSDLMLLSLAYAGASRISTRAGKGDAMGHAQEALRLAKIAGSLRGEASVHMTLTGIALTTGDAASGLRHSTDYLRVAERLGDPWVKACALVDVAFLHLANNDPRAALGEAERALAFASGISNEYYILSANVALAEAHLRLGDPRSAAALLEPALANVARAWPAIVSRGWTVLAAAYAGEGDPKRAADAKARSDALATASPWNNPSRISPFIRMPGGLSP